jgi:hypothetical protein
MKRSETVDGINRLKMKTGRKFRTKRKEPNELRGSQMQRLATDGVPFSRLNVPFSKSFTDLSWRILVRSKYIRNHIFNITVFQ